MLALQALGKEFLFYFYKVSLPSANLKALGKDFLFFFKFLCRVPSVRHSAKFEFFLKNNSLPSALCTALGKVWFFFKKILCRGPWSQYSAKLGKWFSERPFFQLCRVLWPLHSAKRSFAECNTRQSDPKRQFLIFFYIPSWQINSYKHISHIYLIHHIYISIVWTWHLYPSLDLHKNVLLTTIIATQN